jgi:hypothetical protein
LCSGLAGIFVLYLRLLRFIQAPSGVLEGRSKRSRLNAHCKRMCWCREAQGCAGPAFRGAAERRDAPVRCSGERPPGDFVKLGFRPEFCIWPHTGHPKKTLKTIAWAFENGVKRTIQRLASAVDEQRIQ